MALAILGIIYLVIIIAIIGSQFLLYKSSVKPRNENIFFIINMVLIFILSIIVFTSLPSNYIIQKVLAVIWSSLAVIAFIVKNANKSSMIAKVMLTLGLIGNLLQLII